MLRAAMRTGAGPGATFSMGLSPLVAPAMPAPPSASAARTTRTVRAERPSRGRDERTKNATRSITARVKATPTAAFSDTDRRMRDTPMAMAAARPSMAKGSAAGTRSR